MRLRLTDEEIGRFAVHRYEFPGVDLATRQTRHYPYGQLGVHALGYVSAISEQDLEHIDRATYAGTTLIGKLGIESTYRAAVARQEWLSRDPGQRAGPFGAARGRVRAGSAFATADRGR